MKLVNREVGLSAVDLTLGLQRLLPFSRVVRFDHLFVEELVDCLNDLHGLAIESLSAATAERGFPAVLDTAARALDGRDVRRLVILHIDAVEPGEFAVSVLGEDADVASSRVGCGHPAVMLVDMCLVQVPAGEERSRRLPEVGRCDGSVDTGSVGDALECVVEHPVGDGIGFGEFTPERRIGARIRMLIQPVGDVRDRRNERNGSATHLSVDGDLEPMFVVLHVADDEILQLAAPEPGIELEADECPVARVLCGIQHRLNILLPPEDFARVGSRVVVGRVARFDMLEAFGDVFVIPADDASDITQRDAVVAVRFLVRVGIVDPINNLVGSLAVVEGGGEAATLLAHDHCMPQGLFMKMVRIPLVSIKLFVEFECHRRVLAREGVCTVGEGIDAVRDAHTAARKSGLTSNFGYEVLLHSPPLACNQNCRAKPAEAVSGGVAA